MNPEVPPRYIRDNFRSTDRLAVVLIHKETGHVIQRVATAERIAEQDFQAWLRHQNAHRYEIYISMNALDEEARGRTKGDVAVVRHVYLDFDHDGTAKVQALMAREDIPQPNYVVSSSPGKWQTVWKVENFEQDQAETLQRVIGAGIGRRSRCDRQQPCAALTGLLQSQVRQVPLRAGRRTLNGGVSP